MATPQALLPEMTFRPAAAPLPIVVWSFRTRTPPMRLGSAAVPLTSVPSMLPSTVAPVAGCAMPLSSTETAYLPDPAMRLHSPVQAPPGVVPDVPPMSVFVAPKTWMP